MAYGVCCIFQYRTFLAVRFEKDLMVDQWVVVEVSCVTAIQKRLPG